MADWARHYAHPEVFVNGQGVEFQADFENGMNYFQVYQHVIDLEAPWENGPTERANAFLKLQYNKARNEFAKYMKKSMRVTFNLSEPGACSSIVS